MDKRNEKTRQARNWARRNGAPYSGRRKAGERRMARFGRIFVQFYCSQQRMTQADAYRRAADVLREEGMTDLPTLHQVRYWLKTKVNPETVAAARKV